MKKTGKILGLYLLFGIAFALVFSLTGGYANVVVKGAFGSVGIVKYSIAMVVLAVAWCPLFVFLIFSKAGYLAFPAYKWVVGGAIALFALSVFLISKTGGKKESKRR